MRTGQETYGRTSDAQKALVLIEAQMSIGEWTDPDRGKIKLADYAATWIAQRPNLRPRTVDLYRWLLKKHIAPHLGGVPIGKLSTAMIREWRTELLGNGVSVSMAAKGIPPPASGAHDGDRRRQDPACEPVPHPRCR